MCQCGLDQHSLQSLALRCAARQTVSEVATRRGSDAAGSTGREIALELAVDPHRAKGAT
jgi:hypothetical protein